MGSSYSSGSNGTGACFSADCCDEPEDELDLLCRLELLDEDDCVLDCCVLLCLSSFELWCDCEDAPPDWLLC